MCNFLILINKCKKKARHQLTNFQQSIPSGSSSKKTLHVNRYLFNFKQRLFSSNRRSPAVSEETLCCLQGVTTAKGSKV